MAAVEPIRVTEIYVRVNLPAANVFPKEQFLTATGNAATDESADRMGMLFGLRLIRSTRYSMAVLSRRFDCTIIVRDDEGYQPM